jgi:hypothetical protein
MRVINGEWVVSLPISKRGHRRLAIEPSIRVSRPLMLRASTGRTVTRRCAAKESSRLPTTGQIPSAGGGHILHSTL